MKRRKTERKTEQKKQDKCVNIWSQRRACDRRHQKLTAINFMGSHSSSERTKKTIMSKLLMMMILRNVEPFYVSEMRRMLRERRQSPQ